MTSANVTWQDSALDRMSRWQRLGQQGATIWLTGLPAAGKSTIAAAVEERLVEAGRFAYRLDGDNMRHGVCGDLGFSREDRDRNVWRVGEVARLFADAGSVALVSLVSPYLATREGVRKLHERDGLTFIEVFVDTPPVVCERRDPKGLYAKAQAGELVGLTGVDDPYEPPTSPELVLTPDLPVHDAAEAVMAALSARCPMPAPNGAHANDAGAKGAGPNGAKGAGPNGAGANGAYENGARANGARASQTA